ncbi:MAG TPA: hypothetical protein VJ253_05420, partial [Dehalococcoidia bacterium]|nr:hypothetical protein [Dehalococcoidia bacterium]
MAPPDRRQIAPVPPLGSPPLSCRGAARIAARIAARSPPRSPLGSPPLSCRGAVPVRGPYHQRVSAKPFASSTDLAEKTATLEKLAEGVYAYTAEGDPNAGCIVGTDALLAIEARATPLMAQRWIDVIRTFTDLPFRDLVLTHYHAVRVLGAA